MKKTEKIIVELNRIKKANDQYCDMNNIEENDYMRGTNDLIFKMIVFINDLNKKKK